MLTILNSGTLRFLIGIIYPRSVCSATSELELLACDMKKCIKEDTMSDGREGKDTSRIPFIKDASENLPPDVETNEVSDKTEQTITKKKAYVHTS